MANRETARDRGMRKARRILADLARELRDARIAAGLSQEFVARAAGVAHSTLSLIERGLAPGLTVVHAVSIAAVLGLDLGVKLYPVGLPVRDAGHIRLLSRFRTLVSPRFAWLKEQGASISGDLRAFDAVLRIGSLMLAVELETRLYDVQALERRVALLKRDSNVERVILVIADTRHNRAVLSLAGSSFRVAFPCPRRRILASLRSATDPGADGYVLV